MSLTDSGIARNLTSAQLLLQGECWWLRMAARELRDAGRDIEAQRLEREAHEFEQLSEGT